MQLDPHHATPPFRFEPPTAPPWAIDRPRLLSRLAERFDHRVTVVVAGAGFGKSTVLSQAIAENKLRPFGLDVWLRLNDRDNAAEHFLGGLAAALTPDGSDPPLNVTTDDIVESVWSLAPNRVALVLDDTHRLAAGSAAWLAIEELIEQLPRNASVVLSGRVPPRVALSRLRSADDVVEIGERSLEFEPDESRRLAEELGADPSLRESLPRWPALATLTCRAGHSAGIEFLWDEVISGLESERRRLLATLSRFSSIDDKLVAAVAPGSGCTTAELVAGLPLVETDDQLVFRLHDLWAEALASQVDRETVVDAARRAGSHLLERGQLTRAAEAFALAGDERRIAEVVRRAVVRPIGSSLDAGEAAGLLNALPTDLDRGASGALLRATMVFANHPDRCLPAYHRAFELAEAAGSDEDAVVALWRLTQLTAATHPTTFEVSPRLQQLADDGSPMARTACAMIRSHAAAVDGDIETALAELDAFEIDDPAVRRGALAGRYLSLARPELVPTHLDTVLAEGVSDPLTAQAVWFRGEIDPDIAWPIARDLPAQYRHRSIKGVQVTLTGIVAQVGVAAGDLRGAQRLVDAALADSAGVLPGDRMFALAAQVSLLVANGDEAAALAVIEEMNAQLPVLPFPGWSYLSILAPIRGLCPQFAALDDAELGPSLSVARDAGTAIAELRAGGTGNLARALPWSAVELLRAHVPPPLLVELAAAASDLPDAIACLDRIPGGPALLRTLADHPHPTVRSGAQQLLGAYPLVPTRPLTARLLGSLEVRDPDGRELVGSASRGRVRELAALLIDRGRLDRSTLAEELWPDHPIGKARDNLRANLAYLMRAMEVADQPPYVVVDAMQIGLDASLVTTDATEFEEWFDIARVADQQSHPSKALDAYLRASSVYGGEYLPGVDDEAVYFERMRLAALAHAARCRAAELLLAKGEPELALTVATEALVVDRYSEWAHRITIAAHIGLGSTDSGRSLATALVRRLAELSVRPERETEILLGRLGLTVGTVVDIADGSPTVARSVGSAVQEF